MCSYIEAMTAPIRIVYLAWLRERAGRGAELVSPPPSVATVGALIEWLVARGGPEASAFTERGAVRSAVNLTFRPLSAPIAPGDEVAFFPPVTGG